LIPLKRLVLDKIETGIKIVVPCASRQVKQGVWVGNLGQIEHRVLGGAIHFAFIRVLWHPQFIAWSVNGSLGRLPGASRFFLGALARQALRGNARFLGRHSLRAEPRSLATQFIRAVARSGQGFIACFIVGWYHPSQVGRLFSVRCGWFYGAGVAG
jgi:hypothetical protein